MQQELIAGDTLNFPTTVADYPASSGWVLKFRLVPRTGSNVAISLVASAEGDDYRTTASAVITATWAADTYSWTSWVEKATEVYSVEAGQIVVKPDPRTVAAGYDGRSEAQKALDDAKAAYAAWTPTLKSYRIGNREQTFNTPEEIEQKIRYWTARVADESAKTARTSGRPNPRKLQVHLGRA